MIISKIKIDIDLVDGELTFEQAELMMKSTPLKSISLSPTICKVYTLGKDGYTFEPNREYSDLNNTMGSL